MAKYPYIVNKDGIWYKSGAEVPDTTNSKGTENKAEDKANTKPQEASANDKVQYTKTEINRMSTADLQKLAKEHGVSGAEEISGAELKKILIEKFGL